VKPPVFADGKLHVQAERCSSCIFRPGDLMSLRPGRVRNMVEQARADDSAVVCHQTLERSIGSLCRGSVEAFAPTAFQVADRLGLIEWTMPGWSIGFIQRLAKLRVQTRRFMFSHRSKLRT
jgi:hypothetical protein